MQWNQVARQLAVLVATAFALVLVGCPNSTPNLELVVKPTRQQIQTSFEIVGKGFTPNQSVRLSIMWEPRRSEETRLLQTLTADASGSFTTSYTARYPSTPTIAPDAAKQPTFVANDVASGKSKVKETLAAYWYP